MAKCWLAERGGWGSSCLTALQAHLVSLAVSDWPWRSFPRHDGVRAPSSCLVLGKYISIFCRSSRKPSAKTIAAQHLQVISTLIGKNRLWGGWGHTDPCDVLHMHKVYCVSLLSVRRGMLGKKIHRNIQMSKVYIKWLSVPVHILEKKDLMHYFVEEKTPFILRAQTEYQAL